MQDKYQSSADLISENLTIDSSAQRLAEGFLEDNKDCTMEQAIYVYKILICPEDFIKGFYFGGSSSDIKKSYRELAKILHPDKNLHPRSKEAFLKLQQVYSGCKSSKY